MTHDFSLFIKDILEIKLAVEKILKELTKSPE